MLQTSRSMASISARPFTSFTRSGSRRGERVIGVVDLAVELERLIVHAGFAVRLGDVAGAGARQAGFGIDIHQDRQVRLEPAAGDAIERRDGVGAQAAAVALIDQRRIGEAVGKHDFAAVQRRPDHFVHVLRARGEVEQQLGARAQFLIGRVEQDAADLHGDRRSAGLDGLDDRAAHVAQARRQPVHLGRLAGPVHAFEGDEETALFHVKLIL